ncbi:MAG: ATP-dependent sacrificial sulfur transferase LarE [Methanolinea sp.]|nr:ATP-dependent sacrificial sulfur transferase LarE [Methanolinea sp.]
MISREDSIRALKRYLKESGGMVISYSGGLDSSFLAAVAEETVPGRVRCVLLDSPLVPRHTIEDAKARAAFLGIPCEVVPFPILEDEEFRHNPPHRCYICKKRSSAILRGKATDYGLGVVMDGVNPSDLEEFRPGLRAADEEGILHPLAECGLQKPRIRAISREKGYTFWNLLSTPCLATRIPYGDHITRDLLQKIEDAEQFLGERGFPRVRVRVHGTLARIEVPEEDMPRLILHKEFITTRMRELGLLYCTLDLEGLRSGSMDRGILPGGHTGEPL